MAKQTIDHVERKRMVVMKAMRLFAQIGYAKVSFREISEATGVARTVLYRYFKTKRDIFDAAIEELTSGLAEEIGVLKRLAAPATERIDKICSAVLEALHQRKEFFAVVCDYVFAMVNVGVDMAERIAKFTGSLKDVFSALVTEAIANGECSAELDAERTGDILYSLMESSAFRMRLGVEMSADAAKMRFRRAIAAVASNK